jgi:hypothetical protein
VKQRAAPLGLVVSLAMAAHVLAGCGGKRAPPPLPGDVAAQTPFAASGPTSSSAQLASSPGTASPDVTAVCSFERRLTGMIGPANVFAQIHRVGDELAGSYFYEKVGAELTLKGQVTGASVALFESASGKPTGKLDGECQPGGALSGTWSSPDGKRTLPFSLSVPAKIAVGTRRLHFSAKSKDADGLGGCTFDRATPVVFGAASATVERRMAETIARAAKGISDVHDERAARACHASGDDGRLAYFDGGFTSPSQDASVLVFLFSAAMNWVPSAHPSNFAGATVLNLDVATGNEVTVADVVTNEKRLLDIAATCSEAEILLAENGPAYMFLPHGIQVVGTSYGHAAAVATFKGPVISYAALLRDGLLKAGSPIARMWAGVKAASSSDSPCLTRWKLD